MIMLTLLSSDSIYLKNIKEYGANFWSWRSHIVYIGHVSHAHEQVAMMPSEVSVQSFKIFGRFNLVFNILP